MIALVAMLLLFLATEPASARLSRAQLNAVFSSPPAGARIDPRLTMRDISGNLRRVGDILAGRTGFVSFVDYTCNTLCGTDLELLSRAIQSSGLAATQYRIIVIGIDPRDSAKSALEMERQEIPAALWRNTVMLLPDKNIVYRAAAALGFHYVYDASIDQFAHPAVVYAIAPDGALRAEFSPLTLTPAALRGALHNAPQASGLFARLVHLCYAYDPATGVYTLRVERVLRIAAGVTVLLLGSAVLLLFRIGRRAA